MWAVLNHDPEAVRYAIGNTGDDFEKMYLMIDRGLLRELGKCRISEPGVMAYSGLSTAGAATVAGFEDLSVMPTREQLTARVGETFTEPEMMSTTLSLDVAMPFASSDIILVIFAPKAALDEVGSVCINSFSELFHGEDEILINGNAQFRILDVGRLTVNGREEKTYVRVELVGKADD